MLKFIKKYKSYIIGISLGAVAGYLYWRFVGCYSGSCPITSKWYITIIYGMVVGLLIASPNKKKEKIFQAKEVDDIGKN